MGAATPFSLTGKSCCPLGPQFAHLFNALNPEWATIWEQDIGVLVSTVLPAHWVTVSAIWGFSVSNRAVRMVGRSQSCPRPPNPALCALSQDWTLAVLQFPSLQTDKRTCGERCGGKTARLCAPGLAELAQVERSGCHSGLGPVCGPVSNPHPRQACQVWGSGPFDGRRD